MSQATKRTGGELQLPGWCCVQALGRTLWPWRRFFMLTALLSLALHLLVAWYSQGFYHCDEHFQILAFLGMKLGWVRPQQLPWEFRAAVRPWLQPAMFYAAVRLLHLHNPFMAVRLLRFASALLAFGALLATGRCLPLWLSGWSRRLTWLFLAFFYFTLQLAARTSSEGYAHAFFLIGTAVLLLALSRQGIGMALLAGIAFGVAFQMRYQVAFMIAGVGLWLCIVRREQWQLVWPLLGGFVLIQLLALPVDHWGYGRWVYPPWSYVRANLVEGVANRFGVAPFWAYVPLLWKDFWPPFGLLLILAPVLGLLFARNHPFTFAIVPFVLAHAFVGHKETRFLFPALVPSLVVAGVALQAVWLRVGPATQHLAQTKRRTVAAVGVALLLFLACTNLLAIEWRALRPLRWQIGVLERLYDEAPTGYRLLWQGRSPVRICGLELRYYTPTPFVSAPLSAAPRLPRSNLPTFVFAKRDSRLPWSSACAPLGGDPIVSPYAIWRCTADSQTPNQ